MENKGKFPNENIIEGEIKVVQRNSRGQSTGFHIRSDSCEEVDADYFAHLGDINGIEPELDKIFNIHPDFLPEEGDKVSFKPWSYESKGNKKPAFNLQITKRKKDIK